MSLASLRLGIVALYASAVVTSGLLQGQADSSVAQRIRARVASGDSASALKLADSVVTTAAGSTMDQVEGLYWRGLLSSAVREARIDLTRVAVEYPGSSLAADALYRLAQLDLSAGDRAEAERQLGRAVAAYAGGATGGDAAFELGQLLLADGKARDGCAALDSAIARTPSDQVEKRNRMSYTRRPCERLMLETQQDSQPTAPVADAGSKAAGRGGGKATTTRRAWSAQVGAFALKAEADKVAARLTSRGYEARVTPEKPFRVRVGRSADRAQVVALVAKLKSEKTTAIVVEAERP